MIDFMNYSMLKVKEKPQSPNYDRHTDSFWHTKKHHKMNLIQHNFTTSWYCYRMTKKEF